MRSFDFYEFAGVLTPGVILLVGLAHFFPNLVRGKSLVEVSLGASSIVAVLGYAVGHLLQTPGNIVEEIYWAAWGGKPTQWIYSKPHALFSATQTTTLNEIIRKRFLLAKESGNSKQLHLAEFIVTRHIYALVKASGRSDRVDIFNANYGLCRGLAAAFLVLLIVCVARRPSFAGWQALGLGTLLGLSLFRMHRFATHYARELYVQYQQLSVAPHSSSAAAGGTNV